MSSGYAHYIAITTASGQEGSSDSGSFPVLVNTSTLSIASYLAVSGSGGYVQNTVTQSGGNGGTEPADAVFGTTPTCSTLLPWETESYTSTTGAWIAWVQLPTLHHTTQDTFYMCFDKASMSTQQNTGSYAPSAVWNGNAKGIWHVPNGSTLSYLDSTGNGNNGTPGNGPIPIAGQIDGGMEISDYTHRYMAVPISDPSFGSGNGTVSYWEYNQGAYNDGNTEAAVGAVSSGEFVCAKFSDNNFHCGWNKSGDQRVTIAATSSNYPTNTWVYYTLTWVAGGTTTLYANGSSIGTSSSTSAGSVGANLWFGGENGVLNDCYCYLDEMRMWNTNLSADWITAEYNNQKASSTFLTAGSLH
jgi:hypothetical protein